MVSPYLLKGDEQNFKVWAGVAKYGRASGNWTQLSNMNEPRTGHACQTHLAVNDQKIIVAGLNTAGWAPTHTAEAYSVNSNTWVYVTSMPNALETMSFVVNSDNLLMALGSSVQEETRLYVYRQSSDHWEEHPKEMIRHKPEDSARSPVVNAWLVSEQYEFQCA